MKIKFLSILASGLIVLTGFLTSASNAPVHEAQDPAPQAIEQGTFNAMLSLPLLEVGGVQINLCQAKIIWVETGGRISFSIASKGESGPWDRTYAIGPIDLPSGK